MRRVWLIVGGVFAFVTAVGTGLAFGLNVPTPDESANTSLISTSTKETAESVYDLTVPEVTVDAAGEVDIKVVQGRDGRLAIRRESTWATGPRHQEESWNGRWLRVGFFCETPGCGAVYTLAVPEGTTVVLVGKPRSLTCPPRTCTDL
ncbi:hypothetical protein ACFXJ8_38560 [Nonomuraea sp. NPDC059194]|uniref:hypothetical protein n=1 Tax=Nonomuraea sp. NPDC059194 TaxID=3346764 RepID=UPI0036CA016B